MIRNALAHGHFEIRQLGDRRLYLFENVTDDGIIKARMRLSEQTLLDIFQMVQNLSQSVKSGEYQLEKEQKKKRSKSAKQPENTD